LRHPPAISIYIDLAGIDSPHVFEQLCNLRLEFELGGRDLRCARILGAELHFAYGRRPGVEHNLAALNADILEPPESKNPHRGDHATLGNAQILGGRGANAGHFNTSALIPSLLERLSKQLCTSPCRSRIAAPILTIRTPFPWERHWRMVATLGLRMAAISRSFKSGSRCGLLSAPP
jgi:hypothetical protein